MSTSTETPETLAAKFGVTADVQRIPARTDVNPDEWSAGARHFAVTLLRGDDSMRVEFSQGSAHTEDPTAGEVLMSLLLDASFLDESGETFAPATVRQIDAQTAALRAMFTPDEWEVLEADAAETEW